MTDFILTPYALAQFIAAGVSVVTTILVWQRRSVRGGIALFLLFLAVSEWAFGNGLESAAVGRDLKILFSKIVYVGAQSAPVFLLLFALKFSGRVERIQPISVTGLFLIPALIVSLAATNESHHLIWSGFAPGPSGSNSLIYQHGPAFWIGLTYIYILVSFSTALLAVSAVKSQKIYRIQSLTLLLASIMPWVGTFLYLLKPNPFPGLELISISFVFTELFLLIGIARGNLMDYIPVAHELVFKNIDEGVVIFDEKQRIVDLNPAAARLLQLEFLQLIDHPQKSDEEFSRMIQPFLDKEKTNRFEAVSPYNSEVWLNICVSPLRNERSLFLGWVAICEDITLRKNAEDELRRINQALGTQLDDISKLEDQLREQIKRDTLTGVYNRGYLEEVLKHEISKAQINQTCLSLMMLDVDDFKIINDTFGHKAGDVVVIELGRFLKDKTRENDCVSRYGGDEFVLILPGMDNEDARQRAEILCQEIHALKFSIPNLDLPVTVSIGLSTYPKDGKTNDELLSAVDAALYHAKQSGKDCIFSS
jgi:diguanylate cyclase (GGDEF)-like protein/PAS domain S-box-containing protein